jgi:hypothetical protein
MFSRSTGRSRPCELSAEDRVDLHVATGNRENYIAGIARGLPPDHLDGDAELPELVFATTPSRSRTGMSSRLTSTIFASISTRRSTDA